MWRKTLTAERRGELLAHLKGCEKCDHAFRVFALTAPVLHGEMDRYPARESRPARREFSLADRPRRFASALARDILGESMDPDGGSCRDICIRDQRGVSFGAGAQ